MSFGKGEVTWGLPMEESQLNDKGYCKNCNGKVLCFSCKQMRTNNVLINTKKSLTNGIWNVYTSLTSSNSNVNIYKINRMVAHCKWLKASNGSPQQSESWRHLHHHCNNYDVATSLGHKTHGYTELWHYATRYWIDVPICKCLLHELVRPPNLINQMESTNPLVTHLIGGHNKIMGWRVDKRKIPTIRGVIRVVFSECRISFYSKKLLIMWNRKAGKKNHTCTHTKTHTHRG